MKDRFDVAFACDTDHDRHGVVTRSPACYSEPLPRRRRRLPVPPPAGVAPGCGVGKTMVSSPDRPRGAQAGPRLHEVPVGFKWFVAGLLDGSLGFGGEESAGASLLRRDGTVWTTDKDGIGAALLSAEITALVGRDPGEALPRVWTARHGEPYAYERIDAPASARAEVRALEAAPGSPRQNREGVWPESPSSRS